MNSQVKQNPLHALLAEFRATEGVAAKNGRMSAIAEYPSPRRSTMICMGNSLVGVFRCNSEVEVQYSPAVDLITCYYAVHG